jgi:outer membrane protein assembly factor BamB
MKISPNLKGHAPRVGSAETFVASNGRKGWKVRLPGNHPLATPAIADGCVFVGGGFGSYDFYAFDADTGALRWQYQTEDDGPTAAVVAEDRVVFNTESCELEVLTLAGERVWKKWLGDPLLSIPAVGDGRVYMAYPDNQALRHVLACFDLADGTERWQQAIHGEIITAPVLADGHVYLTCLDGTMFCFEQKDGTPLWHEAKNGTSSPAVWRQQCYFSQREEVPGRAGAEAEQREQLACKMAAVGTPTHAYEGTASPADYLNYAKRSKRSTHYQMHGDFDGSVGFAFAKGGAKTHQSRVNLGTDHVYGVWAYQGSKPFLSRGRMFSGMGDTIHCVDPDSKETYWKKRFREGNPEQELLDSVLTPPALANGKVFFGTIDGRVFCLAAENGETLWCVEVGEPVTFQPAVAGGRVYVSTAQGSLYGLETGDPGDDGWLMWGATPAHNGIDEDNA